MSSDYSFWLGLWGSVVGTVLAAIKIWEFYRDSRLGLTTTYSLTSSPEVGNDIILQNTSKTPALISYWELVWADRRFWITFFEREAQYPNEGYCNITVQAHSRYVLSFKDDNHFRTRSEIDGYRVALFLKVYLAGKSRPLWFRVWSSGE